MNWKRIGAVAVLVGAAVGYILWFVLGRRQRPLPTEETIEPWEERNARVNAEFQAETDRLSKAKADEIKRLFEEAFPRRRA